MKSFSRTTIKFSVFLSLFIFFGQTLFAQENKCSRLNPIEETTSCLYQKYLDNYQSNDPEKLKIALEAVKEFVKRCEKFDGCEPNPVEMPYFKEAVAALEKSIKSKSAVPAQENRCIQPVSLGEILKQFRFTSRKVKSVQQINDELISEIEKRKVFLELNGSNKKSLIDAGANEMLLKAIDENLSEENKIKIDLYNRYMVNYQSTNAEQIKEALEIAGEYVRRFEKDVCEKETIAYFKEAISILKEVVEPRPCLPVNPKIGLKWKTLEELTNKFKAKKWNEVFALGRKVYELDPEFVPLYIVLASLGFDQAKLYGNKSKYNDETIFYAELAVKLLENSKKNLSSYGALDYQYKTKAEALAKMKEILDFMKTQNLSEKMPESIK